MTSKPIYCTILEELLADGADIVPEISQIEEQTTTETYYDKIREISKDNKYTKWYINICKNAGKRFSYDHSKSIKSNRAKYKKLFGYTEIHHILPESFGLGGEKDSHNYVFLSLHEHLLVHLLAVSMFENILWKSKMAYAFKRMVDDSSEHRTSLKSYAKFVEVRKGLLGKHRIGVRHTPEHEEKLRQTNSVPIEVNGIKFENTVMASQYFNLSEKVIKRRLKDSIEIRIYTDEERQYEFGVYSKLERIKHTGPIPIEIKNIKFTSFKNAAAYFKITIKRFRKYIKNNVPIDFYTEDEHIELSEWLRILNLKPPSVVIYDGIEFSSNIIAAKYFNVSLVQFKKWIAGSTIRKSTKIVIHGLTFNSVREASRHFNVGRPIINKWIKNEKENNDGK